MIKKISKEKKKIPAERLPADLMLKTFRNSKLKYTKLPESVAKRKKGHWLKYAHSFS